MPQLDKLSFSTQYIWLTFFFWLLYFFILKFFVEKVFKTLKTKFLIKKYWNNFVYNFKFNSYSVFSFNFFKVLCFPFLFYIKKIQIFLINYHIVSNVNNKIMLELYNYFRESLFYRVYPSKLHKNYFKHLKMAYLVYYLFLETKFVPFYLKLKNNLCGVMKKLMFEQISNKHQFFHPETYFFQYKNMYSRKFLFNWPNGKCSVIQATGDKKFIWDLLLVLPNDLISLQKKMRINSKNYIYSYFAYWADQISISVDSKLIHKKLNFLVHQKKNNKEENNFIEKNTSDFLGYWILNNNFLNVFNYKEIFKYSNYPAIFPSQNMEGYLQYFIFIDEQIEIGWNNIRKIFPPLIGSTKEFKEPNTGNDCYEIKDIDLFFADPYAWKFVIVDELDDFPDEYNEPNEYNIVDEYYSYHNKYGIDFTEFNEKNGQDDYLLYENIFCEKSDKIGN